MFRARPLILLASLLILAPAVLAESDPPELDPLTTEAQELLENIATLRGEYHELSKRLEGLDGEERAVVGFQMRKRWLETMSELDALIGNVLEQEEKGLNASVFRKQAGDLLALADDRIPLLLDGLDARAAELRTAREEAEGKAIGEIEARIADVEERTDEVYGYYLAHIGHLESLGLAAADARSQLGERVAKRAETLSGRLELARQQLRRMQEQAAEAPEDSEVEKKTRVAQAGLDFVAARLSAACDVMEEVGLRTAEYRQLLISSTGEITADVLDREVARGLLEQALDALRGWVGDAAPRLLAELAVFGAVLALFWLLSALTRRVVGRVVAVSRLGLSQLARRMLVGSASRIVLVLGFFVALSQLGVHVGALLAGLGIAGFIVGFALQDTLGNFASGGMILLYRPYDVGDWIEAGGVSGRVSHMNLVSTTVLTADNETLVVPNGKIWGDVIKNVTAQEMRRVDMIFGISHSDDIVRAERIFSSILKEHPKILDEPEPMIRVHKLTDLSVEFAVRPWVKTADYWEVYWDVTREVKLRLDREGMRIPVPQRDVRLHAEHRSEDDGSSTS